VVARGERRDAIDVAKRDLLEASTAAKIDDHGFVPGVLECARQVHQTKRWIQPVVVQLILRCSHEHNSHVTLP
jgi:hypothetical protein